MRRSLRVVKPTLCDRSWPSFHLLSNVYQSVHRWSHKGQAVVKRHGRSAKRSNRGPQKIDHVNYKGRPYPSHIPSTKYGGKGGGGIGQGGRRGSRMGAEDCRGLGFFSRTHSLSCRSHPSAICHGPMQRRQDKADEKCLERGPTANRATLAVRSTASSRVAG
ncbi:hypothetical protein LX36DRAFT_41796 [Colletotrichum falcatum]|nr:hypothetical protein LX36DRAFT_41796 [Colletotrichum falcatum]